MPQAALPIAGLALGALGSGGGNSTSTSTTSAPAWATPAMRGALGHATSTYDQGLNPDQVAAQDMIRNRALGGNPLLGQAQGAVGSLLDPQHNPYLDAMFNQAADRTQSRFASEFAGSGRDVSASAPFREMQLGDLATSIYGGAYDADRNRQVAAAGMAPGLAGADYGDAQALLSAGALPGSLLDQYIARIGGIVGNQGTSTGVQHMPGNPLLGALGGFSLLGGGNWLSGLGSGGGSGTFGPGGHW